MSFCPKCGASVFEGARYCMSCNAKISQPGASGSSAFRRFIVKNSGLIKALTVGMCASLVFSFIVNLWINGVFAALTGAVLSGLLVWALFSFLLHANRPGPIPATGFTVIKVVAIIELVGLALMSVLMVFSSMIISSENGAMAVEQVLREDPATRESLMELVENLNLNDVAELFDLLTFAMLAIGAVCVAAIFLYCVPLIKHCNAMKDLLLLDIPAKPARLLPVLLWIVTGFSALSLLGLLAGGAEILQILSSVASLCTTVCGALLLQNASNDIKLETPIDFSIPGAES